LKPSRPGDKSGNAIKGKLHDFLRGGIPRVRDGGEELRRKNFFNAQGGGKARVSKKKSSSKGKSDLSSRVVDVWLEKKRKKSYEALDGCGVRPWARGAERPCCGNRTVENGINP